MSIKRYFSLIQRRLDIKNERFRSAAFHRIKLFENPYTGVLYDDETTTLFVPKVVDRLKDDDSINEILNRNIREL